MTEIVALRHHQPPNGAIPPQDYTHVISGPQTGTHDREAEH